MSQTTTYAGSAGGAKNAKSEIETSTSRIVGRGERIQSVDMGDQPEALPPQQSDKKLL